MFQKPTVFVLGAGSSQGYGLPVGSGLIDRIGDRLNVGYDAWGRVGGPEPHVADVYKALHGTSDKDTIEKFAKIRARLPGFFSIDDFLHTQNDPETSEISKLAIADVIGRYEGVCARDMLGDGALSSAHRPQKWIATLIRTMLQGLQRESAKGFGQNVGFISFNYDRLLEQCLQDGLQRALGLDLDSASTILRDIKIIHPYGSLGPLDWQSKVGAIPFGAPNFDIVAASSGIRTYMEQLKDTPERAEIRQMMSTAYNLVFLGFGFHPQNIALLFEGVDKARKRVFATTFETRAGEVARLHQEIDRRLVHPSNGPWITAEDCDNFALSYMRFIAS